MTTELTDDQADRILRLLEAIKAKTSGDHHLHIVEIYEGSAEFRMTCEHPPVDLDSRWVTVRPDEDWQPDVEAGCWLMSWWDEIGSELLGIIKGPFVWPLPVRPCDDWNFDDAGALVVDEGAL